MAACRGQAARRDRQIGPNGPARSTENVPRISTPTGRRSRNDLRGFCCKVQSGAHCATIELDEFNDILLRHDSRKPTLQQNQIGGPGSISSLRDQTPMSARPMRGTPNSKRTISPSRPADLTTCHGRRPPMTLDSKQRSN
jgi:hypothetical protein